MVVNNEQISVESKGCSDNGSAASSSLYFMLMHCSYSADVASFNIMIKNNNSNDGFCFLYLSPLSQCFKMNAAYMRGFMSFIDFACSQNEQSKIHIDQVPLR